MSVVPRKPLDFGEILDAAFQLYRRDFFDYTIIAIVGLAPAYVALGIAELNGISSGLFEEDIAVPAEAISGLFSVAGWVAVGLVGTALAWTALAAGIAARARDRPLAFAPSYREAFRRVPAVLVAGALVVLIALDITAVIGILVALVAFLAALVFTAAESPSVLFAGVVTVAAFIFMGLIGAWFMVSAFGVLPAVVVERQGPIGALRRSVRLARGARLRIFGVLCVAWIMLVLPGVAFELVAFGIGELVASEPAGTTSAGRFWLVNVGSLAIGSVTTPLFVACTMLLYYDRRVRAEGYDLETAAASMGSGAPTTG